MMRAAFLLAALVAAECNTPPPAPVPAVDAAPPPPPAPLPTPTLDAAPSAAAATVYAELVDAGCLQADPVSGVAWVQQAMADSRAPKWLGCLVGGGSVKACAVPCGDAGR